MITLKDHMVVYDYDTMKELRSKKDWIYILKKYVKIRTNPQNKLLWAIYTLVEESTWTPKEVIHEQMKYRFLKDTSWDLTRIKSTTELSTVDHAKFLDNVWLYWVEQWYKLPSVEEHKKMF